MSETLKQKILSRMEELGIQPKRSLGQNFLVSSNVVNKIVEASEPEKFYKVFEIGPGLGALTDDLKEKNSNLTLIEYDRTFAEFWRSQGLDVNELDALKMQWQEMAWDEGSYLLVSNLPYQISSRLVVDLSTQNPSFERMTLMFQKEVAQRIQAQAGTAEYGLLTVVAQVAWRIRLVLEAGAVDFMPKPNVASRVLLFDRREPRLEGADYPSFLKFLKICFQNRRKKLLPKLTGYQKKPTLKEIFTIAGLNEDVRAEKLEPEQFLLLYFALKKEYD